MVIGRNSPRSSTGMQPWKIAHWSRRSHIRPCETTQWICCHRMCDSTKLWVSAAPTQTLEPRLFYTYIPYRNQDQMPIFDTALSDYNYAQLFTENRFSGGDRFGDANQLTVALTTRFLLNNGTELLRAALGQRYYFADERVGLTPTSPLRSSNDSDILASIGGKPARSAAVLTVNPAASCTASYPRSPWRSASSIAVSTSASVTSVS